MARILFSILIITLFCVYPFRLSAQTPDNERIENLRKLVHYTSELEFQLELESYVNALFMNYGIDQIPREYFLIDLMRLVNKEYTRRLDNPTKARDNYFAELKGMMDEIHVLKQRLRTAGINELRGFVSDLESRIKSTIDAGEVNFKKKKVFEDALQMLYVAEEMIKLDQLQQPEQTVSLNQKITESKKELLTAFGEVLPTTSRLPGARFTIYDLFTEWQKLDQKKYRLRLADVKLARQNLIKSTDLDGILRMLNDQLKMAYDHFNENRYQLAENLLDDVIETYPRWGVKNIDDVYFYRAECNFALERFIHAQKMYEELIEMYPATTFLPQIYNRLVQVTYTLENYSSAVRYGRLYQEVAATGDPSYYDVQYLAAMASYQMGEYGRAIELLSTIPANHPYYRLSTYFMANAYVATRQYDDAIALYLQLAEDKKTMPWLYHQVLYKIGIMEFERQNYFAAIDYLAQIPEASAIFDKVLNALAWCYYHYEQTKPATEAQDYTLAKYYARRVMDEFYASPYQMEARSLLAYINQLENEPSSAIGLYRNVYQTKVNKGVVDEYISERKNFAKLYQQANDLKAAALQKGDKAQYLRAVDLIDGLETEILRMELSEVSGVGVRTYSELNAVISQLEELRELRQIADSRGDFTTIRKIDSLQVRLIKALDDFPSSLLSDVRRINLFDEYPVSKLIAEEENRMADYQANRFEINEEMNRIEARLFDWEEIIQQAKLANNYRKVAEYESQREKLKELLKQHDQLLSSIYMIEDRALVYPEFNKWGDFGAFGVINVQFYQRQQIQNNLNQIALTFDKVNKDLDKRKQVIEDKIKKIEAEIRFMTMKARVEERSRLRAERERVFREGYFDTRTSENEQQ